MARVSRGKVRDEALYHSSDGFVDVSQDINAWKVPNRRTSIAKAYLSAKNHIHVHIIWRRPGDLSDFCAIFQHSPSDKTCMAESKASFLAHLLHPRAQSDASAFRGGYNHDSMLIGVVEFVKSPKGIRRVTIATPIRLKPLNSCDIATEWFDFISGGYRKSRLTATSSAKPINRELGFPANGVDIGGADDSLFAGLPDSKLADQAIQGSPKIMNNPGLYITHGWRVVELDGTYIQDRADMLDYAQRHSFFPSYY